MSATFEAPEFKKLVDDLRREAFEQGRVEMIERADKRRERAELRVEAAKAALLKYDADSHAKHSASEIRWMNIVTGLKERIKELEGR